MEWSNGKKSWVREDNMPSGIKHVESEKVVDAINVVQFGKNIKLLVKSSNGKYRNYSNKRRGVKKNLALQVRRLFEGVVYCKILIFNPKTNVS